MFLRAKKTHIINVTAGRRDYRLIFMSWDLCSRILCGLVMHLKHRMSARLSHVKITKDVELKHNYHHPRHVNIPGDQ